MSVDLRWNVFSLYQLFFLKSTHLFATQCTIQHAIFCLFCQLKINLKYGIIKT